MDVAKICEVVDGCEDCPKYGDDCDGDKMTEHTDLISRADAIEAVRYLIYDRQEKGAKPFKWCFIKQRLNAIPSAELPQSELISRADAIKAIRKCKFESVMPSDWYRGMECAQDIVEELPSANVIEFDFNKYQPRVRNKVNDGTPSADAVQGVGRYENAMQKLREMPKYLNGVKAKQIKKIPSDAAQGEWVEVEDYNGDVHYKCDQCGEEWTFPFGTPKENNANFCPNCGARMKGGAE